MLESCSLTRFPFDELANVVNTATKAVGPSIISTSAVNMIADDNPVFSAHAAIEPFSMKVTLPWRYAMRTTHGMTTTVADTNFLVASPIADVAAIKAPSAIKIIISTLADDDPTSISKVIAHSSSKISRSRFSVDDLVDVVNTPTKAPLNSTLSGNVTNGIVDDTTRVDMSFSTVKVDLATLADDDPPIAVPIYTIFPVRQDRPNKPALLTTSPSNMKVALHSDREKVALLQVKGENNPLVNVA